MLSTPKRLGLYSKCRVKSSRQRVTTITIGSVLDIVGNASQGYASKCPRGSEC